MKRIKRVLALILCGAMLVGNLPTPVFAEDLFQQGLCEHHLAHDNCGYQDTIIGADCSHEHTEECYTQAHSCVHQHGDCSYVESSDEITCDHQCTAENGCISIQLACCHSHDDQCGYAEPQESSPCTYVCEECIQQDSPVCTGALDCPVNEHDDGCEKKAADEKAVEDQAAADAVAALIDALPALEVIQAKEQLDQQEDYNQIQTAYDAYESLTEDQKALLSASEEVFAPYFAYFNTLIMETDASEIVSGTCGENLTWTFDSETGTFTISGTGKMPPYDTGDAYPWHTLRESITKVIITENITEIGMVAFSGCTNLVSLELPESLERIGEGAFSGCSSLTSLSVPDGVSVIGDYAFHNCSSLIGITIPDSVSAINAWAFDECISLNSITFEGSAPIIHENAFSSVRAICNYPEIDLSWTDEVKQSYGGNLAWIGYKGEHIHVYDTDHKCECGAVGGTFSEKLAWSLHNGVLNIYGTGEMDDYGSKASPWQGFESDITAITINEGITCVGANAFGRCDNLINIKLPNSLSVIGEQAFIYCTSLGNITIPNSVVTIGDGAFYGCSSLTSLTIPGSVASIGDGAFSDCYSLTDVILLAGIMNIGSQAFRYCNNLESITIPDSVTCIGDCAFDGCSKLNNVTIPNGITIIEDHTFNECNSLTQIVLPVSLTDIGYAAFAATNLIAVCYSGDKSAWNAIAIGEYNEPLFNASVFYETTTESISSGICGDDLTWILNKNTGILTISGTGAMYDYTSSDAPWHSYSEEILDIFISAEITTIGDRAFADCTAITSVVIPESVTCIGKGVFFRCSDLTSIYIPDSVTLIDNGAFFGCEGLTSITLPKNLSVIANSVFYRCSKLTSIIIPDGVTSIGGFAFWDCADLTSVSIPNTVTFIGQEAFVGCANLTSVSLPESVTSIGIGAFADCIKLTAVTIPEKVEQIGYASFMGCTGLEEVTFGGNAPIFNLLTGDGEYAEESRAFYGVKATIYYPTNNPTWTEEVMQDYGGNLTWVGFDGDSTYSGICGDDQTWVFDKETGKLSVYGTGEMYGADKLNWTVFTDEILSVVIKSGVTSIGAYAFNDCIKLADIEIADTVMDIAYNAFESCSSLKTIDIPENVMEITYGTFMDCTSLSTVTLPQNLRSIGDHAFDNCSSLSTMKLPQNLRNIGDHAFGYCVNLTEVEFPASLVSVRSDAFKNCTILKQIRFNGNAPEIQNNAFYNVQANAYYPVGNRTWTSDVMLNYGGTLTWMEYGAVENRVTIDSADLAGQASVWIDGVEYAVQRSGNSCYVDLPDSNARTMVVHTYNSSSSNRYPVSMKVWILENEDGIYTATHAEIFDDILQYSGMSIRVTGKKGIRMVTSIEKEKKNALVSGGLSGYTLKEYGTVVAWASKLADGNPLTLGQSYAMSNYAYKKGVADPVFAYNGSLMQYTNVLVNFTDEQCKDDLALRPYMILEDAEGEEITLYGGIVNRSIGYIAYQNRNEFEPGTEEYNYIWDIIHYVYGDVYDDEFEQAWTPPKV